MVHESKDALSETKYIKLDWDQFEEQFKPEFNQILGGTEDCASFNGKMYETYGKELKYVKQQSPYHIWTIITGDNGATTLIEGFHFVNRMGYMITKEPWSPDSTYEVIDQEEDELYNYYYKAFDRDGKLIPDTINDQGIATLAESVSDYFRDLHDDVASNRLQEISEYEAAGILTEIGITFEKSKEPYPQD